MFSNLLIILLIFALSYFQLLVHLLTSHQILKFLLLFFLHSIEIIIIYPHLFMEKQRAIIIYNRTIKSGMDSYSSMHDLFYSPQSIMTIVIVFFTNKMILYQRLSWLESVLETLIIVIPLFLTFPVITRLRQFKYLNHKDMYAAEGIYAIFCVGCLFLIGNVNLRLIVILLIPVIRIKLSISHLYLVGIYLDSYVYCVFDILNISEYLNSLVLLITLSMFRQSYLTYNSHRIQSNLVYLFILQLIISIFTLESCSTYECFQTNLNQSLLLICFRSLIIYIIIQLIKTIIIANKDKSYLPSSSRFFQCFKNYFDLGIHQDTLIYKNLNILNKRILKGVFIVVLALFPLNLKLVVKLFRLQIAGILLMSLFVGKRTAVVFLMGLRMGVILFANIDFSGFLSGDESGESWIWRNVGIYLLRYGKYVSYEAEEKIGINFRINKIEYYLNLFYHQNIRYSTNNYELVVMVSIFTLVMMLEYKILQEYRERIKCAYMVAVPCLIILIQFSESFSLNFPFYLLAIVKFLEIYHTV